MLAAPLLAAGCAASGDVEPAPLLVYSPAPPSTPLHALNLAVGEQIAAALAPRAVNVPAIALPDSINQIADSPPQQRAARLPIVTTVDLPLARAGAGPSWHCYPRASPDLKFVAKLYDVGFAIQTRDPAILTPDDLRGKRIGAPPRPSAVRLLTEVLLRDGWDILDEVTLVDSGARQAAEALNSGALDAMSWNLVIPTPHGARPMLPAPPDARYLSVSHDAVARMNAANDFQLDLVDLPSHSAPFLSFAQALAAWEETPPDLVADIQRALAQTRAAADMARWPALSHQQIHPAALEFYAAAAR